MASEGGGHRCCSATECLQIDWIQLMSLGSHFILYTLLKLVHGVKQPRVCVQQEKPEMTKHEISLTDHFIRPTCLVAC